ncbi:hypothetical protein [Streptomyces sp. NPDC037389]|uniref:hypothetical protein n=1 Tax=Streptomyces sp. NPDC037389 TaxID=3155369 RepID=UPI00340ED39E
MSGVLTGHLGREPEYTTVSGARVVWQVGSYEEEYAALRSGAGLADLSGGGPLRVHGPGAAEALNRVLTRDVEFLAPEQAQSALVLDSGGRPVDVVVVLALSDDDYYVHCGPGRDERVAALLAPACEPGEAELANLRSSTSVLAVEGPDAWRVVQEVFGEDYVSLAYESLLPVEVDGVDVVLARIGVTGEYGYTLFLPHEIAEPVWRALAAHSTPVGQRALETAMLEVRQPVLHRELGEDGTVLTAGLNWLVDINKPEFTGREALMAQRADLTGTRPIGFAVTTGRVAEGDELLVGPEVVGRVTYVVDSPGLGAQLGLAAVDRHWQASRLEFGTASGARVGTLAAPYVVPTSWTTPMEV